ncbi:hypothetical protein M1329_00990 [Candidatus Marsarchaeota archaeon]|nr:hypothetical protein [Candidatus Marsarchaeota archaeon]MCL5099728.1 hypothetical protein [Candidatus Marsarchaeota archaeon]
MQKLKERPAPKSRSNTVRARRVLFRVNLLSIKSMLFAIDYALNEAPTMFAKEQERVERDKRRLARHMRALRTLADNHYASRHVSPTDSYRAIRTSITAYVNLFYDANPSELDVYIAKCKASGPGKRLKPEQNMLLIPALMASAGKPKSAAISMLLSGVYKKPFKALYDSSKASLHMEFFKRSIAIANAPKASLESFSQTLDRMSALIKNIDGQDIRPEDDDASKEEFMEQLLKLNDETGIDTMSLLEEKLMPYESANRRVIRK